MHPSRDLLWSSPGRALKRSVPWCAVRQEGWYVVADRETKLPENVPGRFYVDDQCIDCDACRETAPKCFKRNDEKGYSFVQDQPKTPEDEELCMEALEGCPVEAIGDDGGD